MIKKSIKKTINCIVAACVVMSLGFNVTASAKNLNSNEKPLVSAQNQASTEDYSSFNITNGYGVIAKGGVALTKGATADINVNLKVTCVTEDELTKFIEKKKNSFTTEQYNQINENVVRGKGHANASVLKGMLGLKFGNNGWSTYNNAKDKQVTTASDEDKDFLKSLHDLTQQTYQVTGRITAVGQSRVPTIAYCFIEISRIQFQDGTMLKVVNTTTSVGDANGSTSNISGASNNQPLILNEI